MNVVYKSLQNDRVLEEIHPGDCSVVIMQCKGISTMAKHRSNWVVGVGDKYFSNKNFGFVRVLGRKTTVFAHKSVLREGGVDPRHTFVGHHFRFTIVKMMKRGRRVTKVGQIQPLPIRQATHHPDIVNGIVTWFDRKRMVGHVHVPGNKQAVEISMGGLPKQMQLRTGDCVAMHTVLGEGGRSQATSVQVMDM